MLAGIRKHVDAELAAPGERTDQDLLATYAKSIVLHRRRIEVTLRGQESAQEQSEGPGSPDHLSLQSERENTRSCINSDDRVLVLPWIGTTTGSRRGIASEPTLQPSLDPRTRDVLLVAIAKARGWADDLINARAASFAEIAQREGKVERHVRLLAPLAFVSPKIIAAIVDYRVPAGLTVTALARALPHSWAEQEHALGFS